MHVERSPIPEDFEGYKQLVESYSLEELLDIEKNIDPFDFPDRKVYIQELIQKRKNEQTPDQQKEWDRNEAKRSIRGYMIASYLGSVLICNIFGVVLVSLSNPLALITGVVLILCGVILPFFTIMIYGWTYTRDEWERFVEKSVVANRRKRLFFIFIVGFLLFPILGNIAMAYLIAKSRIKDVGKVHKTIRNIIILGGGITIVALLVATLLDPQSAGAVEPDTSDAAMGELMPQGMQSIMAILGSILGALSLFTPFTLIGLLFYFTKAVPKNDDGFPISFKKWYLRVLTIAAIGVATVSLFPLMASLIQMLVNGIFSADMFTSIMPLGKGIWIGLALISEFITTNIPVSTAVAFLVPALIFLGFYYGIMKTDAFNLFVKDIPKPEMHVASNQVSDLPPILQYFTKE